MLIVWVSVKYPVCVLGPYQFFVLYFHLHYAQLCYFFHSRSISLIGC